MGSIVTASDIQSAEKLAEDENLTKADIVADNYSALRQAMVTYNDLILFWMIDKFCLAPNEVQSAVKIASAKGGFWDLQRYFALITKLGKRFPELVAVYEEPARREEQNTAPSPSNRAPGRRKFSFIFSRNGH